MKHQKILTDEMYERGIPVDFSNTPPSICNDIEQATDIDSEESAVQTMLSHAHYIKTSHLLLCESVWQKNYSLALNDISQQIFQRTCDEATVWGTYMIKAGKAGTVDPCLRQYYGLLFSNDDPIFTITAVATLDKVTLPLLAQMQADAMFNAVTDTVAQKRAATFSAQQEQLRQIISDLTEEERQELLSSMARPIDLLQRLARNQHNTLQDLNVPLTPFLEKMRDIIDSFYDDIGLTQGTLYSNRQNDLTSHE